MRNAVLAPILTIGLLLGLSHAVPAQTSVGAILGGNVACDPANAGCQPFPTSASLLCDGTGANLDCPQYFAPDWPDSTGLRFFGLTNRTNPPRCVQSTDGGTVWGLCPSNPFTAAIDNLGAFFTVATDGSLIAAADQGANNCIIRRSTDYGTSWTTVFTDIAAVSCGVAFAQPTPNTARCASLGTYCAVIGRQVGNFNLHAYFSTDNGANWTKGAAFNIVSTDEQIGVQVESAGSQGSLTRYNINYNTAGRVWASTSGGDWSISGLIPTPPGSADGNTARCSSMAMIFEGQAVICGPDVSATTTYRYFEHSAGVPVLHSSFIPGSPLTNTQTPDIMAVGFNAITAYLVGRNAANTQIQINITRDTFGSAPVLATITPATALIGACCRGDIYLRNARIYFTSGAGGANAFFGRIQ